MSDMTFRKAVEGLRAFHTHCRAAAWQTSDGEAVEAVAEQALAHLEAIVAEREAAEQKVYLRYKHSVDPSSRGSSVDTSELTFPNAAAAIAFVEQAWMPSILPADGAWIECESDEDVGRETTNDFRFEVTGIWRVHEGVQRPVPGLAEQIVAAQRAKQAFVDTLARRRRMLADVCEKRAELDRLESAAEQAEAFLAAHRGHLNEDGLREFEAARVKAAEDRNRSQGDLDALVAQLPTVVRRYRGFTVYPADMDASLSVFDEQEDA